MCSVLSKIEALPPLVTPSEVCIYFFCTDGCTTLIISVLKIERLHYQLSLVQRNEAFLLHAGDCAESFNACTHVSLTSITFPACRSYRLHQENISAKIGLILSFSLILVWGARLPIVSSYLQRGYIWNMTYIFEGAGGAHCWAVCETEK